MESKPAGGTGDTSTYVKLVRFLCLYSRPISPFEPHTSSEVCAADASDVKFHANSDLQFGERFLNTKICAEASAAASRIIIISLLLFSVGATDVQFHANSALNLGEILFSKICSEASITGFAP
jgi:hypothetical protein